MPAGGALLAAAGGCLQAAPCWRRCRAAVAQGIWQARVELFECHA
jgi:hypothetical protein